MIVTRLFDLLYQALEEFPKDDFLVSKINNVWKPISTKAFIGGVHQLANGLLEHGVKAGDKAALISNNRPEWNQVDHALQHIGALSVPLYSNLSIDDFGYIFTDSEVCMVFVSDYDLYIKAKAGLEKAGIKAPVYSFELIDDCPHFSELFNVQKPEITTALQARMDAVQAEDVVTLIYTSGTTGNPKGVMLTHHNILSNVKDCKIAVPVNHTHRGLSFLPLCHIYERMLSYLYLDNGVSIYYAESPDTMAANLKEVKPHIFTTVPRLLEKVYDRIVAKGHEQTGIKRALFFWALNLGLKYEISQPNGFWYDLQLSIARKLVFSKWQEALGGNIFCIVSGGAAMQPRLARIFWAAQIKVLEGYGLTETSPVISVNRVQPEDTRVGTVGVIIANLNVKIAADGEILVKGPNVMKGYYKRPDLTAEAIDSDGFFHTGDIGEIQEGKFLKITDRKKEIFKTSGGKYITPQKTENMLKESLVIEQAMVVGEGQKYAAAIITPAIPALKDWCKNKNMVYTTDAEMLKKPEIIDKYQKEIDLHNANLGQFEQIKKFKVLNTQWSIESGEMTPTLKLKRKFIAQKFANDISSLF